jgi:hypothetical protein
MQELCCPWALGCSGYFFLIFFKSVVKDSVDQR